MTDNGPRPASANQIADTQAGADLSHKPPVAPAGEPKAAPKPLSDAAKRALAEAEERRNKAKEMAALPPEEGGRGGKEPVRYGDWEVKGIATDF